jgi:catechol 2,3-dioxygenase-like lactoylglutathione lyase family enzyme
MIRSVPGMTEVGLGGDAVGLMLATAIHRLFGERLPDLGAGAVVRSELYLYVAAPEAYLQRALAHGARPVDELRERDWGDRAGYVLDPDGHLWPSPRDWRGDGAGSVPPERPARWSGRNL